ncbi:hypothetical protein PBT90_07405 [Algoriphagus halophytocola]|uniref:Uncharacterized protein n=1 Tax=Algoriphagus halophytocola TaxID=2991499 RepID=A0ABY6MLZ9_9BACT|nr:MULTISPECIES: hypothetical protein [unclassified Algoriphagus]UZD23214.1 hypothetical protein OM944_01720 [Algoriphagus sp. TR-M5]WBL44507.1 hypothetical protein PBT90_07405 [Algoriphagus sp. TR-M9]
MNRFTKFYGLVLLAAFACQENEDPIIDQEETFDATESEWVRLVTINESGNIGLMNPVAGSARALSVAPFAAGSRPYLSSSGRYITSVMRNEGEVRFFDSGIEFHIDHGHEYEPKWVATAAMAPLPTHFSTSHENIVIFNDGDGSITWAHEQEIGLPSFEPKIIKDMGNGVHHGAATWLAGDYFAVTFKNPAIPGPLPETIKLIDEQGALVAESETAVVSGIHGDASNGKYALFGGMEGVLVASKEKELFLIPNSDGLNPESGNWLGSLKAHDKSEVFYGSSGNKGVFKIDPVAKSITNVYSGDDVVSYFFNEDGSKFIIQNESDHIMVLDAKSGSELLSKSMSVATNLNPTARVVRDEYEKYRLLDEPSPVLTASQNYLYALEGSRTNIKVYDLEDLNLVHTMPLDSPVGTIIRVGFHEDR